MPNVIHSLVGLATNAFHSVSRSTLSYRSNRFQQTMRLPWEQRFSSIHQFFLRKKRKMHSINRDSIKIFPRTDEWYAMKTASSRSRADSLLHQAMLMDFETYLADDLLPKVDLGSMAHALEARSPFLDHEFLEMTSGIPSTLKLKGMKQKWILKEALGGLLPAETLSKKKRGFRLPLDRWFRSSLESFIREKILSTSNGYWNVFDRDRTEKYLNHYFQTRIDLSDHVWALLWLSEWFSQYDSTP